MSLSDAIAARYDEVKAERRDQVAAAISRFTPDPAMEQAAARLAEMRAVGENPPAGMTAMVTAYQRQRYEAERLSTHGLLPDGTSYTKPIETGNE